MGREPVLIAFNKPMNMLSQFTDDGKLAGAGRWIDVPGLYPAGRLDRDSEGLLLLTNDGAVAGAADEPEDGRRPRPISCWWRACRRRMAAWRRFAGGVTLKDGPTRPAEVEAVAVPGWLWPRDPPVRFRKSVPDSVAQAHHHRRAQPAGAAHVRPCGPAGPALIRWSVGPHDTGGAAARRLEGAAAMSEEIKGRHGRRCRAGAPGLAGGEFRDLGGRLDRHLQEARAPTTCPGGRRWRSSCAGAGSTGRSRHSTRTGCAIAARRAIRARPGRRSTRRSWRGCGPRGG
jgi:23S rRNA pseudouridine2457 synthase